MLVWINGPFGGGKTTLAEQLLARLDGAHLFDPELVGTMLSAALPGEANDFQDLPPWRPLVADTAAHLHRHHHRRPLVVPMTLLRADYADEIFTGLAHYDVPVRHLLLHADPATLVARVAGHTMFPSDPARDDAVKAFRRSKADDYAHAHRIWLTASADVIDTTRLTPAEVLSRALNLLVEGPTR